MEPNVQSLLPCPPWCRLDHTKYRGGHFAVLATIGEVTRVELFQPEKDGVREEPMVRLRYQTGGRRSLMEIPPSLAWDVADLIAGIDFRVLPELASALRLPYSLTDALTYDVAPKEEA